MHASTYGKQGKNALGKWSRLGGEQGSPTNYRLGRPISLYFVYLLINSALHVVLFRSYRGALTSKFAVAKLMD